MNNFQPATEVVYYAKILSSFVASEVNAQPGFWGASFNSRACHFCGMSHRLGGTNCPAYGATCANCGKQNHFTQVCRVERGPPQVAEVQADGEPDGYLGLVEAKKKAKKEQLPYPLGTKVLIGTLTLFWGVWGAGELNHCPIRVLNPG